MAPTPDPAAPPSLAERLDRLPDPLPERLRAVSAAAGGPAWLVGGTVRDLLLERPPGDMDIVLETDPRAVAAGLGLEVVQASRFLTVTVRWPDGDTWDLVRARQERYREPAALPVVRPAGLQLDLRRRDFTVNALAASLDPATWGVVLDPVGGWRDLSGGVVRALHPSSFRDDPTRLFRAARYEARLDFGIEPETAVWMASAIQDGLPGYLSPDRLRHELERTLGEPAGVAHLDSLDRHGLVAAIGPGLRHDPWLAEATDHTLQEAAACGVALDEPWVVRLLALVPEQRTAGVVAALVHRLIPDRQAVGMMEAFVRLLQADLDPAAPVSALTGTLDSVVSQGPAAEAVLALAARRPALRSALAKYLLEWRRVRPILRGTDILALGVPRGPAVGRVLARLRAERLDGRVATADDERGRVESWLRDGVPEDHDGLWRL